MGDDAAPAPADPTVVTFALRTVRVGVALSVSTSTGYLAYALATWDRPHRIAILAIVAAALVVSALLTVLPLDELMRGRWRDPFFLTWSTSLIALVTLAAAVDGGAHSPLTVALFLPLAFAALSYPLRSTLVVGGLVVAAFVVLCFLHGRSSVPFMLFYGVCLVNAAWMCAWSARNHDRHHAELQRVSRTDPLTGCLNRRGFEERMTAELRHAQRTGQPVALMILDLDQFKAVNDTQGHAAGDERLRTAARIMSLALRPMDALGRVGGDEFAIALPGAGGADAHSVAKRVHEALAERAPTSLGVATFPEDGTTIEELHQHADVQLYATKRARDGERPAPHQGLSWVAALADAVDARMTPVDPGAMSDHAVAIAERLGWTAEDMADLRLAATLHDVGKVAIPDTVLRKPDPLDRQELEVIRQHPAIGADMIARIEGMERVAAWIRASHEHVGGSGYPVGLAGESIPEASRILLVANAYDAMVTGRPYRRAMRPDLALAELRANAGTQFDEACVEALAATLAAAGAVLPA